MKLRTLLIVVATSLTLGGIVRATPLPTATTAAALRAAHKWIAEEEDNICGISNLKKVTRPALVDYDELLKETPQMQEMEDEGIDPDSAEGKALKKAARTLITKSSEVVRRAKGYCGIWKAIAHRDGRDIHDVTDDVIERF